MSCSCLRYSQTPVGRHSLPLLNAHARCSSTKPRAVRQTSADPRQYGSNNVPPRPDDAGETAMHARHWLRAILRECTYLPDPKARQYVSQHAICRFRAYDIKAWKNRNKKPVPRFKERLIAKHKEARHAVNLLKRANEGELKPLLKVLFMTYGRIGKRRHELMQPLLAKPARDEAITSSLNDADADEETELDKVGKDVSGQELEDGKAKASSLGEKHRLSPALYKLIQSQQQADPPDRTRPNPRKLKPDIPALNSRMRPMPASRVKNMTQKWYADLLDRVLPPLPTDEWCQLRELAHRRGLPKQPPRRKAPHDMESIAQRDDSALEMVIMRGSRSLDKRIFGSREGHKITPRYLQRLYALVWRQCPLMSFDSETSKWSIEWGKHALKSNFQRPIVKESKPREDLADRPPSQVGVSKMAN